MGSNQEGLPTWPQQDISGRFHVPGALCGTPRAALKRIWKAAGDEIFLVGDFNENVYTGPFANALADDGIRMTELCRRTIGGSPPPNPQPWEQIGRAHV